MHQIKTPLLTHTSTVNVIIIIIDSYFIPTEKASSHIVKAYIYFSEKYNL